jgi:hypothetical protein
MTKKAAPGKTRAKSPAAGNLRTRAFGEAADAFGKEVVPLGPRAGALARRVGDLLLGLLEGAVFGLEQVGDWLQTEVTKRLESVPNDQITQPDPRIAVPAVQALLYSMNEKIISQMFANLLASNMNLQLRDSTHPAFVEMIKEMTPADALLLTRFSVQSAHIEYLVRLSENDEVQDLSFSHSFELRDIDLDTLRGSINNLIRLGLIERRHGIHPVLPSISDEEKRLNQKHQPMVDKINASPEELQRHGLKGPCQLLIERDGLFLTPLGRKFIDVCLNDGPPQR